VRWELVRSVYCAVPAGCACVALMSSSHADRQVLWEADVAHLKQTAAELLETNSRYASMFEVRFVQTRRFPRGGILRLP
jgi:hypothetical protein